MRYTPLATDARGGHGGLGPRRPRPTEAARAPHVTLERLYVSLHFWEIPVF